jgi:hypothetical protein
MTTNTDPELFWVRYQPHRVLVALISASGPAELAHRRFCDLVWRGNPWPPADPEAAAALAKVPAQGWASVAAELENLGWRAYKGRLINPKVAQVLKEARKTMLARHVLAKAGARARWDAARSTEGIRPTSAPHSDPIASALPSAMPSALPTAMPVQDSTEQNNTAIKPVERLTFSGSTREQPRDGEGGFLAELSSALATFNSSAAQSELANWGGWWRNRFRENPAKARRILAEIRSMIRERRIRHNPGAAAKDLWDRLP